MLGEPIMVEWGTPQEVIQNAAQTLTLGQYNPQVKSCRQIKGTVDMLFLDMDHCQVFP